MSDRLPSLVIVGISIRHVPCLIYPYALFGVGSRFCNAAKIPRDSWALKGLGQT